MPFIVQETIRVNILMDEVGSDDLLMVVLDDGTRLFLEKKSDCHLGFCEEFMPKEVIELSLQLAEKYASAVTQETRTLYTRQAATSQRMNEFLASEMRRGVLVSVVENQQKPIIDIGRTPRVYFNEPGYSESVRAGWNEKWTASSPIVSIKPATYSEAKEHCSFVGSRA